MMRSVLVLFALAVTLSGCFYRGGTGRCHSLQEYQLAEPGPRVRVPEGLETLPPEQRLPVPYGETQSEPIPEDQPCLDQPPSYNDRAP